MKIATHNAKFHTDDVFAVATLLLKFGKENCTVTRTRDDEVIKASDYVVDVGNIYNPDENRFDHHQTGGAGERQNGIPYASFGLVWKKFGSDVAQDAVIADEIDRILVQSVDAIDNGKDISTMLVPDVYPFDVNSFVNLYRPTWKEEHGWDKTFMECVTWAMAVIARLIITMRDRQAALGLVQEAYRQATDKQLVIVGEKYDLGREVVMDVLGNYPEPLFALLYGGDHDNWQLVTVRKQKGSFESRKPLPLAWRGKSDNELETISGVPGAVFCHRSGFMCVAKTKEAALKLAELALKD